MGEVTEICREFPTFQRLGGPSYCPLTTSPASYLPSSPISKFFFIQISDTGIREVRKSGKLIFFVFFWGGWEFYTHSHSLSHSLSQQRQDSFRPTLWEEAVLLIRNDLFRIRIQL